MKRFIISEGTTHTDLSEVDDHWVWQDLHRCYFMQETLRTLFLFQAPSWTIARQVFAQTVNKRLRRDPKRLEVRSLSWPEVRLLARLEEPDVLEKEGQRSEPRAL